MYYKLYIDSVFFIQFVMNLYLLSITGKILKCTATHRRVLLGALLGAGMICLVILIPVFTMRIRLICGILPVSMCTMRIVFGIRKPDVLIRSSLMMGVCGFFFGSVVLWIVRQFAIREQWQIGIWLVLLCSYPGYGVINLLIHKKRHSEQNDIREIRIPLKQREVHIKALVDTGNHLTEPVSGAPVCIISEEAAKALTEILLPECFHAVPFHSVGKKNGILQAYELPELIIEDSYREIHHKKAIVAICNTGISRDSIYQMILHPQLLDD
ncbi:MAG: sigma-E processing peptidase SpoIIGA [Lachnospiraceae bacterium]|nr:sigma-E processing peptidase SpoIIGA [Lachnospiraceae bacterium]